MADQPRDLDVVVPELRGRQALDAWLFGHDAGILCQGPDPDSAQPLLNGRVVDQWPLPGTRLHRWDSVTVWVHSPDDLAGVREPRRPHPPVRTESAHEPLPPDSADHTPR